MVESTPAIFSFNGKWRRNYRPPITFILHNTEHLLAFSIVHCNHMRVTALQYKQTTTKAVHIKLPYTKQEHNQ